MMRRSWLLVVPVVAVSAMSAPACVELDHFYYKADSGSGGNGGAGGAGGGTGGGSTSTGTAGGSPGKCTVAEDCGEAICGTPKCNGGKCEWTDPLPFGSKPPKILNVVGDCKERRCDGNGQPEEVEDLKDKYSYGAKNSCYESDCEAGAKKPTPVTGKDCTDIPNGKCDSKGQCVECLTDMHCGGDRCQAGKCVPAHCFDMNPQPTESDTDCGNECGPCDNGNKCEEFGDCMSRVCANGLCKAPNCEDFIANGEETDVDCGATCNDMMKLCATGKNCLIHADCITDNCQGGTCQ